jgi:hypothetical protein
LKEPIVNFSTHLGDSNLAEWIYPRKQIDRYLQKEYLMLAGILFLVGYGILYSLMMKQMDQSNHLS